MWNGAASSLMMVLVLAACADPATERTVQEREDARLRVLGDAMFYWRCMHQPVVQAGKCQDWRDAYNRDLAAFRASYGDVK